MADDAAVNDIVSRAVQGINVDQSGQELQIQGAVTAAGQQQLQLATLTHHDVQFFTSFLLENPRAVDGLVIEHFSLTQQALEILRWYFVSRTMSLRRIRLKAMNLGNVDGGRLLSGLHGSMSVTRLELDDLDLDGRAGGTVLSTLLQNNPSLDDLRCTNVPLGVEGARSLQPGIRGHETLRIVELDNCGLGDEGFSLMTEALVDKTTISVLTFAQEGITSTSLHNVTRLIQSRSLRYICVDGNPGLFENQDNFGLFLIALQHSPVNKVSMDFCRLPGHALSVLFQALLIKTTPTVAFSVYDYDQLQEGTDRDNVLEIIPRMRNLHRLNINLDFTDTRVLSALHRSTSIRQSAMFNETTNQWQEFTSGPMFEIWKRNQRLAWAVELLDHEPRRTIPLGLWSTAMARLTRNETAEANAGATAVYKILTEKLVMWCTPQATATAASLSPRPTTRVTSTVAATVSVAAAAADGDAASSSTTETDAGLAKNEEDALEESGAEASSMTTSTTIKCKRPHAQTSKGCDDDDDDDDNNDSDVRPRKKQKIR